jgi:hypothetical protein
VKRLPVIFVIASLFVLANATAAFGAVLVTPSKVEATLAPGGRGSFDIAVVGKGTSPLLVKATAWDFARDANGKAWPVTTAEAATFHGCASWLRVTGETLVARPGEQATVHVEVQTPPGAKMGTYHCYVRLLSQPQVAKGSLAVTYNIDALVVLTVAPAGSVGLQIKDIPQLQRSATILAPQVGRYVFTSPVSMRTTLVNTGNVHVNVKGHFELLNGSRRVARMKSREFTLLPGDRYPVTADWSQTPLFGRMKVRFVMEEGLDKPVTVEQPFTFISSSALVAAGVSLGFVLAGTGAVFARFKYGYRSAHAKHLVRKGKHAKGYRASEQTA